MDWKRRAVRGLARLGDCLKRRAEPVAAGVAVVFARGFASSSGTKASSDVSVACGKSDDAYLSVLNTYGNKPAIGFVEVVPSDTLVVEWATPNSQSYTMGTGWELEWSFVSTAVSVCETDSRTLDFDAGTIMDHASTTGTYTGLMDCTKGITAPAGKEITLTFTRMSVDSSSDCLRVYDSDKADPYQLAASFCGDRSSSGIGPLVLHSGKAFFEWKTYSRTSGDRVLCHLELHCPSEQRSFAHLRRRYHHGGHRVSR